MSKEKMDNTPKKVLFVNPRTPDGISKNYYLPLGLLYLASASEKTGIIAQLLDFNIHHPHTKENPDDWCIQYLIQKIKNYQPDIIVLGCLFSGQFGQVRILSDVIKSCSKNIRTILGGIHATAYPNEILSHCQGIDYIILGEGEKTLESVLHKINQGIYDFSDLDGFAFRDTHGIIVIKEKHQFIENLDEILFPAYHLINLDDYYYNTSDWHNPKNLPIRASLPIITSRGCPMQCSFCPMSSIMGKKYRKRSVENVLSEVSLLYYRYGHSYFSIMDDNFTLDRSFILEFCNKIADMGINIQFDTLNGISVNTLDEEVIEALVKAGLVRVALAIESGSPEIRKCMGKSLTQKKIFEVVRAFKKYPQVVIRGFFIIGMPEDTKESLEATYEMIHQIDIHKPEINNLVPFPGTKVFNQALRDNLFCNKIVLDDLWKIAFPIYGSDYFFIKPYHLSLKDLEQWRIKFNNFMFK